MGWNTFPSSCCTTTMTARTISASVTPFDTSAMSTATRPANRAPTIGTNADTKVSTARGSTSGTSRIHSPRPMSTASRMPTKAWLRTKAPRVYQLRSTTTGTSTASRPGSWRVSHGTNLGPSLRKKNIRKRARNAVTRPLNTVPTPVATAVTMLPTLSWTRAIAVSRAPEISSSPMFSGGPAAHSRSRWMPSTTPRESSPDWDATGTAMSATIPATSSTKETVTAPAATAGGQPCRRRKRVSGQVSVVRNSATTSGHTTDHMRPTIHRATPAISATSNASADTRAAVRRAAAAFLELNVADMRPP